MRLSKIHVVAVTFACLLLSSPAQGQFGKLKDLVKDKVSSKSKDSQNKAAATAQDDIEHKGVAGEAKATYAPGVSKVKNVDVPRRSSGTPEARVAPARGGSSEVKGGTSQVQGGSPQVLSIRVSQVDARGFDTVRGYGVCNKLSNFQILSATQLKVTVDLTAAKSSGTCSLYFRSGGATVFSADVAYKAKK